MAISFMICVVDLPLLEDDLATDGVIRPALIADLLRADMPETVVMCFFPDPQMGGMPHALMGMLEMIHLT